MSETPEEINLDEVFGIEQTAEARMTVKVSYSALYQGRPWYPSVEYGDAPRIVQYTDEDGEIQTVIESESDLRDRVIATAMNGLADTHDAAVKYFINQKESK